MLVPDSPNNKRCERESISPRERVTLKHCSEAVCTVLLRTPSAVTAVACSAASDGLAHCPTQTEFLLLRNSKI